MCIRDSCQITAQRLQVVVLRAAVLVVRLLLLVRLAVIPWLRLHGGGGVLLMLMLATDVRALVGTRRVQKLRLRILFRLRRRAGATNENSAIH